MASLRTWNGTEWVPVRSSAELTQAAADDRYANKADTQAALDEAVTPAEGDARWADKDLLPTSVGEIGQFPGIGPDGPVWRDEVVVDVTHPRFGAIGDGTSHPLSERFATLAEAQAFYPHAVALTDEIDWCAIQALVNYVQTNKITGYMPPRNYHINRSIGISRLPNWAIIGAGRFQTTITQMTDNIPIFVFGTDQASFAQSWKLAGMTLTYSNVQPNTNTDANCIASEEMFYQGQFDDLFFTRGYYGISHVNAATNSYWGCTFDHLFFGADMTGGCINTATGSSGMPNNRFGHIYALASNMTDTLFDIRASGTVFENIEVNKLFQGPRVLRWASNGNGVIHSIKVEGARWTAGGPYNILDLQANTNVSIGFTSLSGDTVDIPSGVVVNMISVGGGGDSSLNVGEMALGGTGILGEVFGFTSGSLSATRGGVRCDNFTSRNANAKLQNHSATTTGEILTVSSYVNNRMSTDKGDADYSITTKDPNIVVYETALTAPRTITLPSVGDDMHNGLYYKIVIGAGVVNGANTLTIESGGTTLHTETTDKKIITFTQRRAFPANDGWVMTGYETTP